MDLIVPVLGKATAQRLVEAVWHLDQKGSARQIAASMR